MIFPFTRKKKLDGANGRNWAGFIILDPTAKYPAAVWAQEAYESMHKLNPFNLLKRATSDIHRRRMEYMGHEIETQVAVKLYGVDEEDYRKHEAHAMYYGYDGLFKDYSEEMIYDRMLSNKKEALRFVNKHMSSIKKFK